MIPLTLLVVYPRVALEIRAGGFEFDLPLSRTIDRVMKMTVDPRPLEQLLQGRVLWNHAEIGCHVEFERVGPFEPDVHQILRHFRL